MVDEQTQQLIEDAVQRAFSAGIGEKRYIDITRIPLICQSIVGIDARLKSIESNLVWGVRIIIGAVLGALLMVILK